MKAPRGLDVHYRRQCRDELWWRRIDASLRQLYRQTHGKDAPEFGALILSPRKSVHAERNTP